MKKISSKIIVIAVLVASVVAFGLYYFFGTSNNKPGADYVNPAFGEYITSYTAGVVPSGSSVRINLANEVDSSLVGHESSVKLFSFSPSIDGKAVWVDRHSIEFKPDKRLVSGQIYEVKFYLSKLANVAEELSTFTYTFQVIPQNFEVSIENVKPYVKTELRRQKIEGILHTADFAEDAAVEKTMSAGQDGKSLSISWTHAGEGKLHSFVVEDVSRQEKPGMVSLSVKGAPIGADRSEDKQVEIPSLSDFKVMNAKVVQIPNQYIILQFSDPLKEKQNLAGLIRVADLTDLEFDIHDNEIWVYPSARQNGTKTVYIEAGVRNILDYKMKNEATIDVLFEQVKPAVRFMGKGSILPSTDGLVLPFEAVSLHAVDVQIYKIFEHNILQFFQVNNYEGNREMYRVGKRILTKNIQLATTGVSDLGKWNRYTLDLSTLINAEPGAIYQVKLSFKKSYSAFNCDGEPAGEESESQFDALADENESYGYDEYEEGYYYGEDYDWSQRENPCNASYYTHDKVIQRNVLASDLGLIAKRGDDGNTIIFVTDLKTTKPLADVQLDVYDYQQQLIGSTTSNAEGKAVMASKENPFALVARSGQQRGYLKLQDGESLSLSNFDVSGEVIQKGLKGFLYGERGVWRPGDSLYLSLIVEDKNKLLPATHPVVFELQNPQGQVVNRLVRSSSVNGFYRFATATASDAPTGNWTGRVKVGGTEFTQTIKIETVKPNRLKINLDLGTDKLTSSNVSGKLDVKWLHGAPGRNLKAEFEVILTQAATQFKKYPDYVFDDPSRSFTSEVQPFFETTTDEDGHANINGTLDVSSSAPGFLTATFRGKAFEESGNFSIDRFSVPYYPYKSYIGLRMPKGERYSGILYTDTLQQVDIATVDVDGNPVSRNDIEINIYKLGWRWWWDNSYDNLANYIEGPYSKLVTSGKVNTKNGKGSWTFEVKSPDWGRYYVRTCDPVSGHCTGQTIYMDQRGWYNRSHGDDERGGATRLSFATDKTSYNIGENVKLTIPSSAGGRALVSVESGSKVHQTYWVETQQGETPFSFTVTGAMTPNVYIHVSLLQPHAQTVNDLPIRLYGITNIGVEDPATHLEPVITMPAVIEPGEEVTVKVSEKKNKPMTYTVAVVDEGLLDITRFKTPDPWNRFYAREALGVRSWDLFDNVMGAFGGRIERLFAIGGDAETAPKDDDARANRFKPVVKFLGPFTLSGGTATHKFVMPQYIGSVRTMVVAGYQGAYGSAEKATPVRKPLMVLATLPRVLGPAETVKLPITLFTQQKNIRDVKVDIKTTGPIAITGNASQTVPMSTQGDMTVDFDMAVKSATGKATVQVTASSGNFKATDVIEIEVRNPNQPITKVSEFIVEAGKSLSADVAPLGLLGTNSATLEVSNIPPIDMGSRLHYLINYPYGCIEQTTSSVFPQLYLDLVKELTENEKSVIQRNVTMGIERLKSFMTRDNGFSYWPGEQTSDEWGSSYAGHFLIEAEAKGYYLPTDMLKRWKKYQQNKAASWRRNNASYYSGDVMQAYRLYTLALAGAPEVGAMNRLREMREVTSTALWLLAASYAKIGQPEVAKKIIAPLSFRIAPYRELGYTYGSDLRDKALILETLILLNERVKGFDLLKEISASLSNYGYWMSTQEVAYCLKAVTAFSNAQKQGELAFSYAINGKTVDVKTHRPLAQAQIPIPNLQKANLKMTNESTGLLYARIINVGTPARGQEEDAQSDIDMRVSYVDKNGQELDVTHLKQGTEFIAQVTISHNSQLNYYQNLALAQVFPSGWEINNLRLQGDESVVPSSPFTYQDIRDDRVYTFFNLSRGSTVTYKVMLTASYAGVFYLPATTCEAMYSKSIYARKKGYVVEVTKGGAAEVQ